MGIFDDAVPGGNIAKPLLVALGVLLAGKVFGGGGSRQPEAENDEPAQVPQRRSPQIDTQASRDDDTAELPAGTSSGGSILDGLGDLLNKLAKNGQGETADSWVKPGAQNKPIDPGDLGKSIGQTTLGEISRRTGISEEVLLEQLSKVLPGVVDKLTPNGTVPSNKEVAANFPKSPW